MFESESFFAGVMRPDEDGYEDDCSADFDEEFAAVEPVNGRRFQRGVREEGVPEQGDGTEIDGEVESLPEAPPELDAEIGSDDHEGEDVESDSANGIFERLLRRVDRINDIEGAKLWGFVE